MCSMKMGTNILPLFLALLLPNFVFLAPISEINANEALIITSVEPNNQNAQETMPIEIKNIKQLNRSKRFLYDPINSITSGIKNIFEMTKMEEEKKLIGSQIEINKEKIKVEKQNLISMEIENKYKEAREKIKVEIENTMLSKQKELLKSLQTENKYREKLEDIRIQIEKTKLDQIEEAKNSILLQKNRLMRKINRLENELNASEIELNTLQMEKSEENTIKMINIEQNIEKIEDKIQIIGIEIINYSRLSLTVNNK